MTPIFEGRKGLESCFFVPFFFLHFFSLGLLDRLFAPRAPSHKKTNTGFFSLSLSFDRNGIPQLRTRRRRRRRRRRMDVQIEDILGQTSNASSIHPASDSNDARNGSFLDAKPKIVCTLGPKSRELHVLEELLRSGMSVARFNFSHGSHEYHQETLDVLRQACANTQLMCAVLLDTKGPELELDMLEDSKPVLLTAGRQVTLTTDYSALGNEKIRSRCPIRN